MRDFRDRLADPLADEVCAALILGHTLGSKELGSVLARLADTTRQRLALRQEGIARQAQVRMSARYAVIIPVLTLVGIRILSPEYLVIYNATGRATRSPGLLCLVADGLRSPAVAGALA